MASSPPPKESADGNTSKEATAPISPPKAPVTSTPERSPITATSSPPKAPPSGSPPIQADPNVERDDDDGADSAIGSASQHSTESLTESIFEYRRLHGRTYQNSKTTEYWAPNDTQQNEGLDLLHNALVMMLDDKLFIAPIGDNPSRVLDVGTGTGIWAIDFADQFPSAEVIGTDLSPIQPSWIPPNLTFMIDDCQLDWTWLENHFDFIHIRALYGSITDWGALYKKAFRHLKPGGWLQDLEMDVKLESDHVEFPPDHVFNRWGDLFYESGERMGRSFAVTCGHTMKENMEAAGFVDIVEKKINTPCHGWPKDPRLQHAGYLVQYCLEEMLDGLALFILTQVMGWTREEVTVLVAQMRKEVRRKANYAWCQTTVVYGRKPLDAT